MLPDPLDEQLAVAQGAAFPKRVCGQHASHRSSCAAQGRPRGSDHHDTRQLCSRRPLDGGMLRVEARKAHPSLCPIKGRVAAVQRRGTKPVDANEKWVPPEVTELRL